jgi:hypothetical protein
LAKNINRKLASKFWGHAGLLGGSALVAPFFGFYFASALFAATVMENFLFAARQYDLNFSRNMSTIKKANSDERTSPLWILYSENYLVNQELAKHLIGLERQAPVDGSVGVLANYLFNSTRGSAEVVFDKLMKKILRYPEQTKPPQVKVAVDYLFLRLNGIEDPQLYLFIRLSNYHSEVSTLSHTF